MNEAGLVAAIVADPDDEAAWMVYADWLLERNHPRGELMQLGPRAKAGDNEARWQIQRLEVDETPLLSPRLAACGMQWRFGFQRGFISLAEFQTHATEPAVPETVSALCADPHAGLLKKILIDVASYAGGSDARRDASQRVYKRVDIGNLDRELANLRWLEHLAIHGVACDELSHRNLRRLSIDSITSAGARIDLPALETLDWRPMDNTAAFGTVLNGALPNLRSICIQYGYAGLVGALAEHRLARQLETFLMRTDDLATLTQLVTHAHAFPNLKNIRIDGIVANLTPAEVNDLRTALERAYPAATSLYAPWHHLAPRLPRSRQPPDVVPEVDDQSRRADGTIDAGARFRRGR